MSADTGALYTLVLAWEHQRDQLVDVVRRLRVRHPAADSYDRLLADRAAASVAALDSLFEPTAADLVRRGRSVDEALDQVDAHVEALYARMGGKP
jgi:hypothetical protein